MSDEQNSQSGYDVAMIRDFLEHLMWEVRIARAESTHLQSHAHPDLVDALARCMERRDTPALLAAEKIVQDGATDDEMQRAAELLRAGNAKRMLRFLKALIILKPLFDEALTFAERGSLVVREWKARDVITMFDKKD